MDVHHCVSTTAAPHMISSYMTRGYWFWGTHKQDIQMSLTSYLCGKTRMKARSILRIEVFAFLYCIQMWRCHIMSRLILLSWRDVEFMFYCCGQSINRWSGSQYYHGAWDLQGMQETTLSTPWVAHGGVNVSPVTMPRERVWFARPSHCLLTIVRRTHINVTRISCRS